MRRSIELAKNTTRGKIQKEDGHEWIYEDHLKTQKDEIQTIHDKHHRRFTECQLTVYLEQDHPKIVLAQYEIDSEPEVTAAQRSGFH